MISRHTATRIGDAYKAEFSYSRMRYKSGGVYRDKLYDFLFSNDYASWFCNTTAHLFSPRGVKEWIMRLHTGETQAEATPEWSWEARRKLGQEYLRNLAEDILQYYESCKGAYERQKRDGAWPELLRSLELDGYAYRDGRLCMPESDVLDVEEETGLLRHLYEALSLANRDTAFDMLRLSEEHYLEGRWSDCIVNSRKFLESVLLEVARAYAQRFATGELDQLREPQPRSVRQFLEDQGLIEKREKEALDKVYGLLSHTGAHPYMAENDQARLLRQLSLTLSQFAMLRLQGRISAA